MEAMIEREIGKFGETVSREIDTDQMRLFVQALVGEVARDMAENGTSAVSDATLAWFVDVCLPAGTSEETGRRLKARVQNIAFFTNDERRGYRKFFHDKFYEYFLSIAMIGLVVQGETGKVMARSLFGSSLLETFGEVISTPGKTEVARAFLDNALAVIRDYPPIDRTRRNVAALAIAALMIADIVDDFRIESVGLDEARFTGSASQARIGGAVISQFDCRGADLSQVEFIDTFIDTLIADGGTRLPDQFPIPTRIRDITQGGATLSTPVERDDWISRHLSNPPETDHSLVPSHLRDHDAFKLLFKVSRLRQYWLRRGDDVHAGRILNDPLWLTVEEVLINNDLLTVELRQASGTDAQFIHVRQANDILSENAQNENVVRMFRDLVKAVG